MTTPNPDSVLDSVKKALGLSPDITSFDIDVIMHVNSVIGTLQQLGVNNNGALYVSDNTTLWSAITTRQDLLNLVKTYAFVKVRLIFDPPASGFVITAIEKQIQELEWRINVMAGTPYSQSAPPASASRWWILNGLPDFPSGAVTGDLGIDFLSGNVYGMSVIPSGAAMWDLTGLSDFPLEVVTGELGFDSATGNVYVKDRILTRPYWWDLTGLSDFPAGSIPGDYGIDFSNKNVYCNGSDSGGGFWWDLTGLSDFPSEAVIGDLGYDTTTGNVWRKTG